MPGHYGDDKKKKKKMPNHVGLVEKLGKKSGKKGTGKQMLLDMMKKNLKRHQEGKKKKK